MVQHLASRDPSASGSNRPAASGGGTGGFYSFNADQSFAPAVNLYETDTAYLVCVDLAGVEKSEIDVELRDHVLTVKGTREVPTDFDPDCLKRSAGRDGRARCRIHVMEIDNGPFARSIELPPDADRDHIEATHRNGLLWVSVPKSRGQETGVRGQGGTGELG